MFKNKKAFTLAEALTALTVLGVLAAISLPIIITNYNDHANVAAQKAMGLDLTHAMQTIVAEDGSLNKLQTLVPSGGGDNYATFNEAFVKEKLVNVLKIARTCNPTQNNVAQADHPRNCGFRAEQSYLTFDKVGEPDLTLVNNDNLQNKNFFGDHMLDRNGNNIALPNELPYIVSLANGASALVMYNQHCRRPESVINGERVNEGTNEGSWQPGLACVNIIYDVNGAKGPNQVGRDVGFFTAFYPTRTVFGAPVLYEGGINEEAGPENTGAYTYNDGVDSCANLAPNNKAGIPTYEQAASIYINAELINEGHFTSGTPNGTPILNKKHGEGGNGLLICVHQ